MNYRLYLQLFAAGETSNTGNGTGAIGTYIQTTGDGRISAELKDFYTKDLIEMVGPNLIHAQFGEKVPIPKGHKRNIEWRKFSKFSKALQPLTEGVTPAPHSLAVTTVTKELKQYGDYSILSDILEIEAVDPIVTEYTARHAENATLTLDTLVRNDLNCGTNVRYASNWSGTTETENWSRETLDATAVLKVTDVKKAATDLKRMNAPTFNGDYVAIIHPSVAYDIMADKNWIDASLYAGSTQIFNGEIGKLYGVRFVQSTEAKIWGKSASSPVALTTSAVVSGHKDQLVVANSTSLAANALQGRLLSVETDGVVEILEVASNAASESATTGYTTAITFTKAPEVDFDDSVSTATVIKYADANASVDIYSCLFLGKGAYKVVSLEGGNMEVIVKSKGSAGTADPLDQRSTIGWKCNGYGAGIVIPEYILRVECASSYDGKDGEN